MVWSLTVGDARSVLAGMGKGSVHTCVTSPPYFGLRDYGVEGQIGLEATPAEYIAKLVEVFEGVRRVLRDDGTLWIVIGDSYVTQGGRGEERMRELGRPTPGGKQTPGARGGAPGTKLAPSVKAKDLLGIPWMLAFALRDAGWYLRQEIIWAKGISGPIYRGGSCMPESVKDRCTRSHETIFMLSKVPRYYYDHEAIREEASKGFGDKRTSTQERLEDGHPSRYGDTESKSAKGCSFPSIHPDDDRRNRRSVWHVNSRPFKGAHFATFPPNLIEPMILAGAPEGGTVLDPFAGAGTTGVVAIEHGRSFLGIELNPEYAKIARPRLQTAWREHTPRVKSTHVCS